MAYPQDIIRDAAVRYTRNGVAFSRIESLPFQAAAIRRWLGY